MSTALPEFCTPYAVISCSLPSAATWTERFSPLMRTPYCGGGVEVAVGSLVGVKVGVQSGVQVKVGVTVGVGVPRT